MLIIIICYHGLCVTASCSDFSFMLCSLCCANPPHQLEATLGVSISQVGVDECPFTDCSRSGGCSTDVSFGPVPVALGAGSAALVSLPASVAARCGCRGREAAHLPCSSYPNSPCRNGGACRDGPLGYRYESGNSLRLFPRFHRDAKLLLTIKTLLFVV